MSLLRIDPQQDGAGDHAWRLDVTGDLDGSTVEMFDATIDDVIGRDGRLVVLDLTDVSFLDSSGLRSIMRASNLLAERDGRLTLAGLSGAAKRVLEVTGLLDRIRDDGAGET